MEKDASASNREKLLSYIFLPLIAILSFTLYFFRFHNAGLGNTYYAVTVKSMLTNWHNFIFASYDPGGFVTVDKPPVALWLQCASAAVFGFRGWSLLLPQAAAGVVSVLFLYFMVRKTFGAGAGLVSSLTLAVTPIFAAVSRTNELDPVLVMVMIIAAYVVIIAAERGSLLWLLVAMAIAGIGFNTKMLEAYLAVPAFYAVYLFSAPVRLPRKVLDLAAATAVLIAVSLSWAVFVDLTPPGERPFVGSSRNNSELNLAIGYNGINRVLPRNRGRGTNRNFYVYFTNRQAANMSSASGSGPATGRFRGGMQGEGGLPGILRIFNLQMAGQISWLFPVALLGAIVFVIRIRKRGLEIDKPMLLPIVFWCSWVLPMLVYFSETGFFHRYYLCMLAPGLAALTGIGFRILYDCYMEGGPEGWALPVSLIANAALQALFLSRYPGWAWMILFIPGLTLAAAAVLVIGKAGVIFKGSLIRLSIIIGAAALFVLPLVWSVTPIAYGDQESAPFAGPELLNRYNYPWVTGGTNNQAGPFMGAFTALNNRGNMKLSSFLVLNRKNEKFLAGVPNAMIASPIILGTGQPVMAMGGFMGRDNILTTESLEKMVGGGEVRFFLVTIPGTNQNRAGFMTNQGNLQELFKWIIANGRRVPKDFWSVKESGMISNDFQFRPGRMAGLLNMQLYDCGGSNENSILPAISP